MTINLTNMILLLTTDYYSVILYQELMIILFPNITITSIESFISVPISAGVRRNITKRASSSLVFSPRGISNYYQDDKVYVSDNTYVLFLPDAATYSIKCIEGDICPLINFRCGGNISETISFPTGNSQLLLDKFKDFEKIWVFDKERNYYNGMVFLYEIFAALSFDHLKIELKMPEVLKEALDFMHANYTNPNLSNDSIAQKASISTVYFRKLFKKYYHISPMKYISDIRLQQAWQILKEQALSIQDVAFSTGFSSLYHFSRAFKNATAFSPSQYKNLYRTI